MAVAARDIYDVRMRRPRLTSGDLIVLIGAVVLFLAGWAIKDWHDNRLRTAASAGVTISYPRSWVRFPTKDPEIFRAVSSSDGRSVLIVTKVTTPQTDVLQAVATNNSNPARGEAGYAQLGNKTASVAGNQAVATDYAYVQTSIGGSTVPAVIRGRQYSWIQNGQLYTFALEGAESQWKDVESLAKRLIGKVKVTA
jgi:hypothetical protein